MTYFLAFSGGGGGGGGSEDGWTVPNLGKTSRQPYSVEASKLNTKSLPLDEIKLGSRNAYVFGGCAAAAKPTMLGTPNKYAALEHLEHQEKQRVTPQLPGLVLTPFNTLVSYSCLHSVPIQIQ